MTDAFMTAVAVAAAATGTTRITGIANQHVKECDRIAAMVEGLAKCGVVARNLPDGIEVDGAGRELGARLRSGGAHGSEAASAVAAESKEGGGQEEEQEEQDEEEEA